MVFFWVLLSVILEGRSHNIIIIITLEKCFSIWCLWLFVFHIGPSFHWFITNCYRLLPFSVYPRL